MKRIISTLLATTIVANCTTHALIASTFKDIYRIGEGTSYTYQAGTDSSGLQKSHYIQYKPNSGVFPIVVYGSSIYSKSNIISAKTYAESLGYTVIGGINADFYTMSTGIPSGLVMRDGEIISSDAWQNAIGFNSDGSAFIDKPGMNMRLYYDGEDGGEFVQVNYYNKTRSKSYVYLLDSKFNSETKVSTNGTDIVLERQDDNLVTPQSELSLKVVEVRKTNSSTPIKSNQFVLTIDDTISDKVPNVKVGDTMKLITGVNNTAWTNVEYAVGGGDILIKDGVVQSGLTAGLNPRSALGIKSDGTIVIYEVDGRSEDSKGLSLTGLANELLALGCVNAINLDGGGSSSIISKLPATTSSVLTNTPSEGSMRANSNYIMFVTNEKATNNLSNIHIYIDNLLMLTDSTINIDVKATDDNFFPVELSKDYTLTTHKGETLENNSFTPLETGYYDITATCEQMTDVKTVRVLDKVHTISVQNEKTMSYLYTLALEQGESIDLFATSTFDSMPVVSTDASYQWLVEGDIGEIDENGVFVASNTQGTGSIIIKYGQNSTKTIPVSVGFTPEKETKIIADDGYMFDATNATQSFNDLKVANGMSSLKVDYKPEAKLETNIKIEDYTILNGKILIENEEISIYAEFEDSNGNALQEQVLKDSKINEFNSFSIDIPQEASVFKGFSIKCEQEGTLYLDNIILSNEYNDNKSPIITLSDLPQIVEKNLVNISGTIFNDTNTTAKNVQVFVNGKEANFSYGKTSGAFNADLNLDAGINNITIIATDVFNNMSKKTYSVSVANEQLSFVDTQDNWAKDYIEFAYQNKIVTGEVIDNQSYFNPSRNLTRAEFAVIISRFLNLQTSTNKEIEFADEKDIPSWALEHVIAVSNEGIMNGSQAEDGIYFNCQNSISRAEVITVLGRITQKGFDTNQINFADNQSIPNWSFEHFKTLVSYGVLNGYEDNTIRPLNNITRAEVCKLIYSIK